MPEIKSHEELITEVTPEQWASTLSDWADHPCATGFVPVCPTSLRKVSQLLRKLANYERNATADGVMRVSDES